MATRKMNEKEWATYIELQKRNKEMKKKLNSAQKGFNKYRKYLMSSWVIGLFAAIIMLIIYGWSTLLETILSWTIGVTVITTFFAAASKYKLLN